MNDFPLYRVDISDNDSDAEEVNFIALVKNPAVESNFLKFNDQMRFEVTNEEERIVTGLAMIADLPILRRDKERGEFFVYFDAAAIKKIALRFFRKGYNRNMNLDHDPNRLAKGVYIFESLLIDREKGKVPPKGFEDAEDGSWIISAKVDNDETWKDVKAGKFQGFSVEGIFILDEVKVPESADEKFLTKLKACLQEIEINS